MDALTDDIESILFIAREVMGESSPRRIHSHSGQSTSYPHGLRRLGTKLQNGTSSLSSGRDAYG